MTLNLLVNKPRKGKTMKTKFIMGFMVMIALAASLYARDDDDYWDCAYCGVGETVVVDPPETPTVVLEDCAFCGSETYSSSSSSSSSTGWNPGANWSRAASMSIYLVNDEGVYVGNATITTSKKSSKGKVSVKVVFKLPSGKSVTAKKTAFTPDSDGTIDASWSKVSGLGSVSFSLTPSGEVSGTAGSYEFSDSYELDDGDGDSYVFRHGAHIFSVDVGDYTLSDGYELIDETIPTEMEVITSSKKWECGKAPSIKYKKIKEDGETSYELVGLSDDSKTNVSNLKITFNAKKNTFKGSFKVYATNEGSIEKGKPKLKSYSFSVTGSLSGGQCVGTATCKKLKATWSLVVE